MKSSTGVSTICIGLSATDTLSHPLISMPTHKVDFAPASTEVFELARAQFVVVFADDEDLYLERVSQVSW
jgi:hypothetical protein